LSFWFFGFNLVFDGRKLNLKSKTK